MAGSSEKQRYSEIDLKQRYPFLVFYLSALAFSVVLLLAGLAPSSWHQILYFLAAPIGLFSLWSFYRLLTLSDERQRDTNNRALRFGFLVSLAVALIGGFVRGFFAPVVSCGGLLVLMTAAWCVGLILYSWRYR